MTWKLRTFVTVALALSVVAGLSGGALAMTPADADADGFDSGFDDGVDSIEAADGATGTLSLSIPCPPHLLIPEDPECI